jgi:hypothetical protein
LAFTSLFNHRERFVGGKFFPNFLRDHSGVFSCFSVLVDPGRVITIAETWKDAGPPGPPSLHPHSTPAPLAPPPPGSPETAARQLRSISNPLNSGRLAGKLRRAARLGSAQLRLCSPPASAGPGTPLSLALLRPAVFAIAAPRPPTNPPGYCWASLWVSTSRILEIGLAP